MSASVLREAAALMRERAEEVGGPNHSPSPWAASLDTRHNGYEVLCHQDATGLVAAESHCVKVAAAYLGRQP